MSAVLWLRRDLRRGDLPALGAAAAAGDGEVHVLFVVDPVLWDRCGPIRRGWLAASIRAAAASYDGRLTVRVGDPVTQVARFASDVGAASVHVSAETTPYGARRDRRVSSRLAERDLRWLATGSPYAVGPGRVLTQGGTPYRVFTPFARAWREQGWAEPATAPHGVRLGAHRSDDHADTMLDRALADCPVDLPPAGEEAASAAGAPSATSTWATTPTAATAPTAAAPRGCRRTSRCGAIHPRTILADLAGDRSAGGHDLHATSWPGASSTPTCCHSHPDSAGATCDPSSARCATTSRRDAVRGLEGRAGPATRSSTPACASCSRPAGCTTGCG